MAPVVHSGGSPYLGSELYHSGILSPGGDMDSAGSGFGLDYDRNRVGRGRRGVRRNLNFADRSRCAYSGLPSRHWQHRRARKHARVRGTVRQDME